MPLLLESLMSLMKELCVSFTRKVTWFQGKYQRNLSNIGEREGSAYYSLCLQLSSVDVQQQSSPSCSSR